MIDPKYMEWMGNLLLAMGKSQQVATQWSQWLQTGGKAPLPWSLLDIAGNQLRPQMDPSSAADADPIWENYRNWLQVMGGIPIVEYRELQQRVDELEKTCRHQKDTIQTLQAMLATKEELQNNFLENMNDYMSGQGEILQQLFGHFMEALKPNKKESDSE